MLDAPRAWLVGLAALALLIRIPALFVIPMWYDEAVEGLMSQDILRGRFPIFFYGQPVHGAVDRYVAALSLLLFGPTPLALKLPMLALFFAFLGSIAYTTRRIYGARVATLATLFVAIPPYYYFGWNFDSRGHYPLMLLLGVWVLYLAWQIGREGVAQAPPRRFVGLGLLAGLAWWTNYLSLTFLAPVALALAWQGARALRAHPWPVLARAALVGVWAVAGMTPLLGYYLSHGIPLRPPGRAVEPGQATAQAGGLVVDALPPTLGVHPDIWGPLYVVAYPAILALTVGAVGYAVAWWVRNRRLPAGSGTVGLLLGLVAITCLLSVTTQFGAILRFPRYLLPLTLALPVFFGLALDRVGRASPVAQGLLIVLLVGNNLSGSLRLTPVLAEARTLERQRHETKRLREELEVLTREGIRHVYGGLNHWPFLSKRHVIASDPYRERMAEFVREVDAAEHVAWAFRQPTPAFEYSARAAGIDFRIVNGPGFVAYTDFRLGDTGYVDLDPTGWSSVASPEPQQAELAHDRRLDTAWRARVPQAPGQFYRVDLGRVERIGLIAWMPWRFQEVPAGFRIAVSGDGLEWQAVADVPQYFGPLYWSGTHPFQRIRRSRVEVRFTPVDARHVRIELTAGGRPLSWSMRELVIGRPADPCLRHYDPRALVALLRDARTKRVYADHWISANIAKHSAEAILVLPANLSVTSYRLERPDPDTIEVVEARPGRVLVVEACPPEVGDAVAALLEDSGVAFRRTSAGGFVAFTELRPLSLPAERAAWRGPSGGWVEARLESPRPIVRVVVECAAPLAARTFVVEGTADGERWEPLEFRLARLGRLRMSGSRLFRDGVETVAFTLPPRTLRGVRVALAGSGVTWCPIRAIRLGFASGSRAALGRHEDPGQRLRHCPDLEVTTDERTDGPPIPVLHVPGCVAEAGEIPQPRHVHEPPDRLVGHTEDHGSPGDPAKLVESAVGVVEVFEHLAGEHDVERGFREREPVDGTCQEVRDGQTLLGLGRELGGQLDREHAAGARPGTDPCGQETLAGADLQNGASGGVLRQQAVERPEVAVHEPPHDGVARVILVVHVSDDHAAGVVPSP
jgi:hypothetical protein